MTAQEIIDELNAARLYGLDNWRHRGPYVGADCFGKFFYLTPDEALREAERLRRVERHATAPEGQQMTSEETPTIKPCPPGCSRDNEHEIIERGPYVQRVCICGTAGKLTLDRDAADAAWNALPRRRRISK